MGNTTANTFSQKGANHVAEYKGYTITRSLGRRGFTIKPSAGETPRVLKGQWLKQEEAKHQIDAYLNSPEVKSRNAAKEAQASRKAKRQEKVTDNKQEETTNAEGSSE